MVSICFVIDFYKLRKSVQGGADLTGKQRKLIRNKAAELKLIPKIEVKESRRYLFRLC